MIDGRQGICKGCRHTNDKNRRWRNENMTPINASLEESYKKDAIEILEALGYDFSSKIPVHEQFNQRWGRLIDSSIENNKSQGLEDGDTRP